MAALPLGNSPTARRRRAASSLPHDNLAKPRGSELLTQPRGMFTIVGSFNDTSIRPTPDVRHHMRDRRAGRGAGAAGADDLGDSTLEERGGGEEQQMIQDSRPQIFRHNACFLHPNGLDDGSGWGPARPYLTDCRYHDMVRETIHMAGSRDVGRIGRILDERKQLDAENAEWSQTRFRKQREAAKLWQELQPTFDGITGRPSKPAPNFDEDEDAPRSLPTPSESRSSAAQRQGSMASSLYDELSAAGLAGNPRGLRRGGSEPGLGKGRGPHPAQRVPVRQKPGSRGLPQGFVSAVAMHTGVLMYPKDRNFTLEARPTFG